MSQPKTPTEKVQYFQSEAAHKRADMVVLVEDKEDEPFWGRLLMASLPDKKCHFPYTPPGNGKDKLLRDFGDLVQASVVICVDSDNAPFISTQYDKHLSPRQRFIYQTYAHSLESNHIYPTNLESICWELTRTAHSFGEDFAELSEALYDWLLLWLFFSDESRKSEYTDVSGLREKLAWESLKKIASVEHHGLKTARSTSEAQTTITLIAEAVQDSLEKIRADFKVCGVEYPEAAIQTFAQACPISPSETLFFIRGHLAFDHIVLPYFNKVVSLSAQYLASEAKTKEDQNRLNNLSREDHRTRLSLAYKDCLIKKGSCLFIEQVKGDIQADFNKH